MLDVSKIIYDLREKVKKNNPDYSDKEVSAYIAGMIYGFMLSRTNGD